MVGLTAGLENAQLLKYARDRIAINLYLLFCVIYDGEKEKINRTQVSFQSLHLKTHHIQLKIIILGQFMNIVKVSIFLIYK